MASEPHSPESTWDDPSVPWPRLDAGTMLGQFRIVGLLGRGGMGVVYEAEDTRLRRRVAIKVLNTPEANDEVLMRRLRREAQAVARLSNPHVVAVHHIGDWEGGHFLVMELMHGGSLESRLRSGPMPWREATAAVIDACRGLAAAHAAELVHRDIKPANLMSDGAGTVKIADFGLVAGTNLTGGNLDELPDGGKKVVGTAHYMSPEQCRGEYIDERSDLYSLGATYFALLTGRPPFIGDPTPVMLAHCNSPAPAPRQLVPDLPPACVAIVHRALAKKPADRYQSADEMLAALTMALTNPEGLVAEVRPEAPRRWRVAPLVAAGIAAVLLLVTLGLVVAVR